MTHPNNAEYQRNYIKRLKAEAARVPGLVEENERLKRSTPDSIRAELEKARRGYQELKGRLDEERRRHQTPATDEVEKLRERIKELEEDSERGDTQIETLERDEDAFLEQIDELETQLNDAEIRIEAAEQLLARAGVTLPSAKEWLERDQEGGLSKPLPQKIEAEYRITLGALEIWEQATIRLAEALAEGRTRFGTDKEFALWLIENEVDYFIGDTRAALVAMGTDGRFAEIVMQDNRDELWKWFAREMQERKRRLGDIRM